MKCLNEQCLFCGITDETITLTVEHELKQFVGGNTGYACYSVSCSYYREHGCNAYGVSDECKALISQAQKLAKEELLSEQLP